MNYELVILLFYVYLVSQEDEQHHTALKGNCYGNI